MENCRKKQHWEAVYETKNPDQVSWTQKVPKTSLEFINSSGVPKDAQIIDVGGGDSNLVDFLLDEVYVNITVLDISAKALEKTKERWGGKAQKVNWVVSEMTKFEPQIFYDIGRHRGRVPFLNQPKRNR